MTESVARAKLRELQTDLAARAAELKSESKGLPELTERAAAVPLVDTSPATSGATAASRRQLEPTPRPVQQQPAVEPSRPKTKATRPTGKVQAVITGSSNHSAVGRILFKAGNYRKALQELAPLEKDRSADLGDLFYLARCHEELHRVVKEQAAMAKGEASKASARAEVARRAADAIRDSGRSNRAVGGTMQSKAEHDSLRQQQAAATSAHKTQTALADQLNRESAHYYEKAYNVFILIEGRDLRSGIDGKDAPGQWAEAARSARNMMQWISTRREWTPPAIQWNNQ